MRISVFTTVILALVCGAALAVGQEGESLQQPQLLAPNLSTEVAADQESFSSESFETTAPPVSIVPPAARGYHPMCNGRFACPVCDDPSLRRLGPCPGACEVSWYSGRLWFRTELLAWDAKESRVPAPVTPADWTVHDELRLGGRFTVGWWCARDQRIGVEAVYLGLGGEDEAQLVAHDDGLLMGERLVRADSEIAGAEVLVREAVWWTDVARIDVMAGYRHAHLFDRVLVDDSSTSLDTMSGYAVGNTLERFDQFNTENNFHGGELGLSTRWWHRCWSCQLVGKLAYGGVFTKNGIYGQTIETDNTGPDPVVLAPVDGGVFVMPGDIGRADPSDPTILTEIGFNLEYQLRWDMRVALGYTLLYWDAVTRAPALVQQSINTTQFSDVLLDRTSFWAQGLNASFEYQF